MIRAAIRELLKAPLYLLIVLGGFGIAIATSFSMLVWGLAVTAEAAGWCWRSGCDRVVEWKLSKTP